MFQKLKNTLPVDCNIISNGDIEFCNCNPCSEYEGHCDSHDECQDGLFCGANNCPASFGFGTGHNCCYQTKPGDENFCTTINPCGEDEGDCDSNEECQKGLECNIAKCPSIFVNNSLIDCCHISK